jgi:5-methyltetrahydrofolate--homocysteine methyltransferase
MGGFRRFAKKGGARAMIIIGERINGAIPSIKDAIARRDAPFIREITLAQVKAGADYLDCAPSTATNVEYETMLWLLDIMQGASDTPICIDSPDAKLLTRIIEENHMNQAGIVNSVNEENNKCETIFPAIVGTDWDVIGLTCDQMGIPQNSQKKVDIAKRIIDKADRYGIKLSNLHIDPCVMALATVPHALGDFVYCIKKIHEYAPEVKVTGAISNMSYEMPSRKYINAGCLTYALQAGLDSAIMDPCSQDMMGTVYAAEALLEGDTSGRKYNRASRMGIFGKK